MGRPLDKFAEEELFAPLGLDRYDWFKRHDGTVFSNGDLLLTPPDLAKLGLLVLNNVSGETAVSSRRDGSRLQRGGEQVARTISDMAFIGGSVRWPEAEWSSM